MGMEDQVDRMDRMEGWKDRETGGSRERRRVEEERARARGRTRDGQVGGNFGMVTAVPFTGTPAARSRIGGVTDVRSHGGRALA